MSYAFEKNMYSAVVNVSDLLIMLFKDSIAYMFSSCCIKYIEKHVTVSNYNCLLLP
jgi:hypothetical protein